VKLDLEDLRLDDPETYEIFSKAYTSGVFSSNRGDADILRRYQPARSKTCARSTPLSPGPIQGGMVDDFMTEHGARDCLRLPEPAGDPEETYGVIVYQEQVMQISNCLAGYSLGEADILRRAMGKKDLRNGRPAGEVHGRGDAKASRRRSPRSSPDGAVRRLRLQQVPFGAYAYLAFVTAYLKAHYRWTYGRLLTSERATPPRSCATSMMPGDGIQVLPRRQLSDWNFHADLTILGRAHSLRVGSGQEPGPLGRRSDSEGARRGVRFSSLYQFLRESTSQR